MFQKHLYLILDKSLKVKLLWTNSNFSQNNSITMDIDLNQPYQDHLYSPCKNIRSQLAYADAIYYY